MTTAPLTPRIPAQAWAAALAFCALWIVLGSQIVEGARRHDFLNLYTGASLALEGNFAGLHRPEIQLARERRFVPELRALVPFVRPSFYAMLLAPLALLPFALAFWAWLALQTATLLACWRWAVMRWGPDALIFGSLYLPTALGIAHGQDCVFLLAISVGAYTLAERERDGAAGVVLALGLIKFHLWLLWPLALLLQKRWRMLAFYALAAAAEALLASFLSGAAGLARYVELLRNKDIERLNPSPELAVNLHGLALNLGAPRWAEWLLIGLTIAFTVAASRGPLWRAWAAASAGSLLIAPHVYGYDAALLLLGLWLVIFTSSQMSGRLAATALATPLPFLLTLAGPPWAGAAPALMLCFLGALAAGAFKSLPTHAPQSPVSS